MKKIIMIALMIWGSVTVATAQEAYNEGMKMAKENAENESLPMEERKIATFKYDALQYLGVMSSKLMPDSSTIMLDNQTLAMYNYVNLFTKHFKRADRKDKVTVVQLFGAVSQRNPLFNKSDEDKEWATAYINNDNFITKFSLNTDWVKALDDVQSLLSKALK